MTNAPPPTPQEVIKSALSVLKHLKAFRHCGKLYGDHALMEELAQDAIDMAKRVTELEAVLDFYADPFGRKDLSGEPIRVPDFYSEMDFGWRAEEILRPKPLKESRCA
jgi:hypothetical protein